MSVGQKYIVTMLKAAAVKGTDFKASSEPHRYMYVLHCGNPTSNSRVGWIGVVVGLNTSEICVHWFCTSPARALPTPVSQWYDREWAVNNLKYRSLTCEEFTLIRESVDSYLNSTRQLGEDMCAQESQGADKYIVWNHKGDIQPK